jgi:hypothetical protein
VTRITLQDGKIVLRDGKAGTEEACCCGCPPECRVYYTLNVSQATFVHIFFPDPEWDPDNPLDNYRPISCSSEFDPNSVNPFPEDIVLATNGRADRCPDNPECQLPQEQFFCNFPQLPTPPFPDECECGFIETTFARLSCECLSELSQIAEDYPAYIPAYYVGPFDAIVPLEYIVVPCDLYDDDGGTFQVCDGLPP